MYAKCVIKGWLGQLLNVFTAKKQLTDLMQLFITKTNMNHVTPMNVYLEKHVIIKV